MSTWALVLAAGEGSRLRALTTTNGVAVPKQFCSLHHGPSLLQEALHRAEAVAPRQRICTIVAVQHRRWWEGPLWSLPSRLFEQRYPEIVAEMRSAVAQDRVDPQIPLAAEDLYGRLPELDFSRHVLEGAEQSLRVLPVPACGWSDLGTPKRVAEALRRIERNERSHSSLDPTAYLSLAAQHARLQMAM